MHYLLKKITALLCAVILILSVAVLPVSAQGTEKYGIVTASLLNLRKSPSTQSAILAQIPYGTSLSISKVESGWAQVTYGNNTGFVSAVYLNIMDGALPSRGNVITTKGQAIVEAAKQFLGTPYVYGGSSPSGFDCSGFVYYLYKNAGVTLNRVAADQMTNGTWVPKNALQPGDIVGFANKSGYINHVGIYAGNGMMIHSPQTGDVVKYESIVTGNYANRLTCGRRIFN